MALLLDGTTGCPVTTVTGTLPVANGGTGVTTSTGSGANVLGTSPTLTTPVFNSATFATVSGTAPIYGCRAWVNFDGTTATPCTIRGSGNVTSVTKNATGDYTINFTTAMTDANYVMIPGTYLSAVGDEGSAVAQSYASAPTTSAIRIANYVPGTAGSTGNTLRDQAFIHIAIFR